MAESVHAQLRSMFAGRPVILAGDVDAGSTLRVEALQALGVDRILVIATGRGTGRQPEEVGAEVLVHELPTAENMVAGFRDEEAFARNPPPDVAAAVEAFDPDRSAIVLVPPFFAVSEFGDRPAFGARRPEWVALEDKTRTDELFDDAGVERPPSAVARLGDAAAVAARLDCGVGTVWSGDARDGFNGGAVFVRWVTNDAERDDALAFFGPRCDSVRIAPFVEGVPCSVHGIVTPDGIATLRPVELVTLRAPVAPRLRYFGCATYFDPDPADVAYMQGAVRSVGETLRRTVDFRGVFTVDGILSAEGWLPTECNPRFGAALGYALKALPELPLQFVNFGLVEGSIDVSADFLESELRRVGDAHRWGGAWTSVTRRFEKSTTVDFGPDARLTLGPGHAGGFIRLEFDAARVPAGPSIAPRVVEAFARADAEYELGLGPLTPALSVR